MVISRARINETKINSVLEKEKKNSKLVLRTSRLFKQDKFHGAGFGSQ